MKKSDLMNAKKRIEAGESVRSVARSMGVHHSLLQYYQKQNWQQVKTTDKKPIDIDLWKQHYSYTLGLYLGDGHITEMARAYRLRITLDSIYPNIINQAVESLEYLLPNNKVRVYPITNSRAINVTVLSNRLPKFFPQHGEGVKHERDVSLKFWQENILMPEHFVRGLIHSDGSRFIRTVGKYQYESYQFTNLSRHIVASFCWALRAINVKYKIVHLKHIMRVNIDKREFVAILDSINCNKD